MTTPLTTEQLEAIRERLRRATPGPWTAFHGCIWSEPAGDSVVSAGDDGKSYGLHSAVLVISKDDAALIAHAPTDINALLAEVERLRAENERLRSVSWQNTVNRGGVR